MRPSKLARQTTRTTITLIPVRSFAQEHSGLALTFCSDSEISTDNEDDIPEDETLTDRFLALRDIIPPTTRSYISNKVEATTSWVKSGLLFSGKTLWVVSTSALLLGVPWALAFAEEQQMVEMEKEMRMREMGGEVCTHLFSHMCLRLDQANEPDSASQFRFSNSRCAERTARRATREASSVINENMIRCIAI